MERPFNLKGGVMVFCFVQNCFFGQHKSYNIYFFCRAEFNIRLYDKNSESDFYFPPPKSGYFFQQHWESEYFFRKKTITPLQVKWSFPYSKPFLNNKIKLFCDEYHADIFSMHNFSPLKQKKYNFVVLIQTFSCFIST
jgi:hypothetical protein